MAILTIERPRAVPSTRAWQAVSAAVVAIAWGGNEFTPLLVMYKGHGLAATAVDLLLFYYVLGIVPALLVGGPLSDRFGRRPLMLPAPLVAAAGSLLLAAGASSVPMLAAGRMLCGVALGLAMAVGGSWLKELSGPGVGARRSAMSLTAGFALGAGVAGVLAQWGPLPDSTAYLVNVALCVLATAWLVKAPETVRRPTRPARLLDDLKIPAAGHRRFLRVAVPVALWLFTANATAYAVLPTLMLGQVGEAPIAFSALVTMVTLGCGFTIQSAARRIDRPGTARAAVLALVLLTAGMVLAAWTASTLTIGATLLTAVVLGSGYGIGLVAGLQQIERIAGPGDLAGLNAVFYSVSYLGFGVPAILSALHGHFGFGYPAMYLVTAVIAAACLALVAANYRERV
ncbi:MFS transporter [Nocardia caishijiensis]|uniref:MFS family arabinose efflux permease n=1 Tax=Nocardia caishijiensis TaxID=184756 RepID=A0ABQ6YKQ0_9NOCA|nr:MFS transporter [Nocardia caishijiensis]KAF0846079.1 putative MFS family arabinose efflux permease [Nocardia caishijiensis]